MGKTWRERAGKGGEGGAKRRKGTGGGGGGMEAEYGRSVAQKEKEKKTKLNSLSPFDASVKPKKKQPGTPGRIFKEESEGSSRMRIKRAAEFEENRNPDGSCKNMYNFSLPASGRKT